MNNRDIIKIKGYRQKSTQDYEEWKKEVDMKLGLPSGNNIVICEECWFVWVDGRLYKKDVAKNYYYLEYDGGAESDVHIMCSCGEKAFTMKYYNGFNLHAKCVSCGEEEFI